MNTAQRSVDLSWATSSDNPSYYRVYRRMSTGSWDWLGNTSGTTYTVYSSGLSSVEENTFYKAPVNTVGTPTTVEFGPGTSNSMYITPDPVPWCNATSKENAITLNWGRISGDTGSNVRYCVTINGSDNFFTASSNRFGLWPGTRYPYEIKTYGYNTSLWSATTYSGEAWTLCSSPTPSATGGPGRVNLTWTQPTGATRYNIYRSTAGGSFTNIATVSSGTTTSYTDVNVNVGTTYAYSVTAFNGATTPAESAQSGSTSNDVSPTATTHTLTYESQTGSAISGSPFTVNHSELFTAPTAPKKTGYDFGGWY